MSPLVSIIIPCYNHGKYITEAIESVLLFKDKSVYEIIIVDDGSTDEDTIKVLKKLEQDGYYVIHQPNGGLPKARNMGIMQTKGKYILPLDSDNKIRPEFIEQYMEFEKDDKIDVVYGDYEIFGEKSEIFRQGELNLQRLFIGNQIDACAMFRKAIWEKVGGYDDNMAGMGYEDWDFWLRIAVTGGKFKYVNKLLYDYRYLNNSMLRSIDTAKFQILTEYMQKKHSGVLDKKYLNDLVFNNISKNKSLTYYIFIRFNFPRIYSLLRKVGMIKKKDLI